MGTIGSDPTGGWGLSIHRARAMSSLQFIKSASPLILAYLTVCKAEKAAAGAAASVAGAASGAITGPACQIDPKVIMPNNGANTGDRVQ